MNYPRVLVIAMGRINGSDAANNGLLLRNLFGFSWPRENLAQIFSSGDNGDDGFFGHYYQLGSKDRVLGRLFYRLKAEVLRQNGGGDTVPTYAFSESETRISLKSLGKWLLIDSGCYELIFRPRISREMYAWVKRFRPDIIFSQGYCLSYTWLPIMLADRFGLPLSYYPTDDWPSQTYRSQSHLVPFVSKVVQHKVSQLSRRLVDIASLRIAFNRYMCDEYLKRYGKPFSVLMHGDDASRFGSLQPFRLIGPDEYWIISTGIFNRNRIALLTDLEQACVIMSENDIRVRVTVFPVNKLSEEIVNSFRFIQFAPCPSHQDLASILKGADILFLPERFDETASGIALSISSKAHLFMFSGKPIVVYSDPVTGIARYAAEEGWAAVVNRRDSRLLAATFQRLIEDVEYRLSITAKAERVAKANHNLASIQSAFNEMICSAV